MESASGDGECCCALAVFDLKEAREELGSWQIRELLGWIKWVEEWAGSSEGERGQREEMRERRESIRLFLARSSGCLGAGG